jgi:hypothetical protein
MTSTPALEATASPRPDAPGGRMRLVCYAATGFSAVLAAQACSRDAVTLLACLLGIALGAIGAAELTRTGRIHRPWLAYGIAQIAMSACCLAPSALAPLAAVFLGACGAFAGRRCYLPALAGALLASLAGPLVIFPALGSHGAPWICLAIGAAICALTAFAPGAPECTEAGRSPQPVLAASFGSGATLSVLAVIWRHLAGVAIGSLSWVDLAIVLGLFLGAVWMRTIRWYLLFSCAAVLLTAQFVLWDRVPGVLRLMASPLCVSVLLLAPVTAILGSILPRLLSRDHGLAGYLWGAYALGWLSGTVLAMFVLVPLAGAEVSLKALVLVLGVFWAAFLRREPFSRRRIATSAAVAVVLLAVLLGRWWNWGLLTAGHAPVPAAPAPNTHYLPPSFIFKHEDLRGGFTTVVEQTVVTGEVGHTIRTLFSDGRFRGDDTSAESEFVPVPGASSALLIGLGTGRNAAALKTLGYREIVVAETAPGIVKAARECFASFNQSILNDPRVTLSFDAPRSILANRNGAFGLIAIVADAEPLYTREFYQLAHRHLQAGGLFEQPLALDRMGPEEITAQLATAHNVFPYVGIWNAPDRSLLVAGDRPLPAGSFLSSDGVARLLAGRHPRIHRDGDGGTEYGHPSDTLAFLSRYR